MVIQLDSQLKTNIIPAILFYFPLAVMTRPHRLALLVLPVAICIASIAAAEDTFTVAFKDHKIVPEELQVPAGQKFILVVDNQDATPEEFESHALKREKVVAGKSKVTVKLGPLKPGSYDIFGEYHESTAKGRIVAK